MSELDRIDRRILNELQADGRITNAELAHRVGLAPTSMSDRMRRLQKAGYITGFTARIDPKMVDLELLVFVEVSLDKTTPDAFDKFSKAVRLAPEVLECHSMSGTNDYLLRIVAASIEAYERFMSTHLLQLRAVRSVNTSFVLRTRKLTTRLPVDAPVTGRSRS